MKILLIIATIVLVSSCKTLEPLYLDSIKNLGYKGKLDYWKPEKVGRLSRGATKIRNKLYDKGAIIFYSYKIDSNGIAREIKIERTIPSNFITTDELVNSKLIYPKFVATSSNTAKMPVKVYERMAFFKNKNLMIPSDEMTDEDVIKEFSSKS